MKNFTISFVIISQLICFTACSQKFTNSLSESEASSAISKLIEYFPEDQPGGTLLLSQKGKVISTKSFGKSNLETKSDIEVQNTFRIASLTKPFTAIAIFKLVENGKLSLNDKVSKFIPDFPEKGNAITIGHLLSHSSGMAYKNDDEERKRLKKTIAAKRKNDKISISEYFREDKFDSSPGEKFDYNNVAYYILGFIIEQVTSQTYADFLNEQFFKPLKMYNTRVDRITNVDSIRALGYDFHNGEGYKKTNLNNIDNSYFYSAGGIVSNVADLQKWYNALFDYKIINKQTLEKVITPVIYKNGASGTNGYGFFIGNLNGNMYVHHDGFDTGYGSIAVYFPKQKLFITHLRNCGSCMYDIGYSYSLPLKIASLLLDSEYLEKIPVNATKFEGTYRSKITEDTRIVTVKNNKLYVNSKYGDLPAMLINETTFFVERTNETIKFEMNVNSEIKLTSTIAISLEYFKD